MATAGAVIASSRQVVEIIVAAEATSPIAVTMPAAAVEQQHAVVDRECAAAAVLRPTATQQSPGILEQRGPAPLTLQPLMSAHRVARLPQQFPTAAAVVDMVAALPVVVAEVALRMVADSTGNR
jgi:hypothetical protein